MVDSIVGLQWGSEGKGKIVAYLSPEYDAMVRSGGSQAGHTFYHGGRKHVRRQIPCGVINLRCKLYLSANSLVSLDLLASEIREYDLRPDRLMIDYHSMVVTSDHVDAERSSSLEKRLASTGEGIGAAQSEKVWRRAKLFDYYAESDPELYFYAGDTVEAINIQIQNSNSILLEGTQGIGLDLNHGIYPFVTSRSVLPSSLLSDAGISPKHYNQTIGVMRTYPIRVGGNSGPTYSNELTWKELTLRSGSPKLLSEITTVTKRLRRIFEQSYEFLEKSFILAGPDQIALTFLDYINYQDFGKTQLNDLSTISREYINELENRIQTPITLISTGPGADHIIDRRSDSQKAHPVGTDAVEDLFPKGIYGYEWSSQFVPRMIDKKMLTLDGDPWKRQIFV